MAPPKRPWFRFYVEAVHDRKLRRQKPETRWLFVACLAAARQSPIPGFLLVSEQEAMDAADLADFAGMTTKQVVDGMKALEHVGVIETDLHLRCWRLPKWNQRQYESDNSTTRAAKSRRSNGDEAAMQRPNNGDVESDATPPETETDTDTERVTSEGTSTSVASTPPAPPEPPEPPAGRMTEPRHFVEIVDPAGPVAIRRETTAVLDEAARCAKDGGRPLLDKQRDKLRGTVHDALKAGYDSTDLARAIASSPFRTPEGVLGELGKRKQPLRRSVGDTGLDAAAEWLAGQERA